MVEKKKTTRTRKRVAPEQAEPRPSLADEPPLSARLAFVVQFRLGAGQTVAAFSGRVEHMVTGQAARFASEAELAAFLRRVLRAAHAGTEQDP